MNYDPRVKEFLVHHFGDTERVSHAELVEFLESLGLSVNPTIASLKADGHLSKSRDPRDRPTVNQLAAGVEPPTRYRIAESVVRMPLVTADDLPREEHQSVEPRRRDYSEDEILGLIAADDEPEDLSLGHRPLPKLIDPNTGPEFGYAWPAFPLDLEKLKRDWFVSGDSITSAKLTDCPGRPGTLNDIRGTYVPTEEDKELIRLLYPDMDPEGPLWWRIRADLITDGMDVASLAALTAPEVIAVLKRKEPEPSQPSGAQASDGLANDLAKWADPSGREQEQRPFDGGTIVYLSDRVELCGVEICSGDRAKDQRELLEILSKKENGRFKAYSSERLATALQWPDGRPSKDVAGRIKSLRKSISRALQQAGIRCGEKDIVLSGGPGYRLNETIAICQSVQPETGRFATDATAVSPAISVPDVSDMGVPNVPDQAVPDVPNVPDPDEDGGSRTNRCKWIVERLTAGLRVGVSDVMSQFGVARKTAQRDFNLLKEKNRVEFVGEARTGYYRLMPPATP